MATIEQIIKLLDAGYTREQISIMDGVQPITPEPTPEPTPKPTPKPTPEQPEQPDNASQLISEVNELKNLIKNSNIMLDKQPPAMTAEEALASFFKPRG